jgi:hypothetical protein
MPAHNHVREPLSATERGVHLVVSKSVDQHPTSVCIVRVSPRGGGTVLITVAVAQDVESDSPGTNRSYADAEDVLAAVSDFLRRSGATSRTNRGQGRDK